MDKADEINIPPHQITDTLKNASWHYSGCGYWIDPVTKNKHQTNIAFQIAEKRIKKESSK
jgi:hypothetical protein